MHCQQAEQAMSHETMSQVRTVEAAQCLSSCGTGKRRQETENE